jgi:predicted MFS family arabinose efflux permease
VAVLLPVSAVRGLGFAVLRVVVSLLTTVVAPRDRHGEAVGLYGLSIALPNLLAVPGGVALTQAGSFWVVAALGAAPVLAVPAALALGREHHSRPDPRQEDPPTRPRSAVRATAAPGAVLLATTLAAGGLVTYLPIAQSIAPTDRPSGPSAAVVGLLVFGLTGALTRWQVGVLVDRLGLSLLLPCAVVASCLGVVAVATGLHSGSGAVVVIGALLFGGGYGAVQNLTLVSAFARAGSAGATSASSVWNAAFDAGTAIGAVALGALTAGGLSLPQAFLLAAALILSTLAVAPRR